MINLKTLKPNKVSVNLSQYSMIWTGDTGIGKTTSMMKFLKEVDPEREPLFLEFEDRWQNIEGIMGVKINTMSDFMTVISQLKSPEMKKTFSCIVIDTLDKYEEFCEKYVLQNRNAEILKDVGGYGEGHSRFKSALRHIGDIQILDYPVHYIAQSSHLKDNDTKAESDTMKLNKNTYSYCRESAYLVGYMDMDKNGERYITFKKSPQHPDLKDTFGLPDKIALKELKEVWTNSIKSKGSDNITEEQTISKAIEEKDFETIKKRGIALGGILAENGHLDDATAVLQKNLGLDDNGNVKMFDSLRDNQIDLTEVIVMELEEICKKYKIETA